MKRIDMFYELPEYDLQAFRPIGRSLRLCSSGGTNATSTTMNYSPEESARRTQVMDEAQRIYNATAGATQDANYPGTKPVPFSPQTTQAQGLATQYATGPATQQAENINKAVNFGLSDVLYPSTNPALQQTIDAAVRPITYDYMDPGGVFATIRGQAQDAGQFGGSRQGMMEGIGAGRYAQAASDAAAKIATEGYNQGLDTFSKTLAFAPQSMEAGLMPSNILSGIGVQNETQAQQLEDYLANARTYDYNAPWTPLQNYANIVFGGANPSTTSTQQAGGSAASTIGSIGSAALGLSQLIPLLATSDRRMKKNIVHSGLDKATGLNLYDFDYIDRPGRYRGVMADEVERVMPDAVLIGLDGMRMVNYGMLGIKMQRLEGGNGHV
jgi:hypothetical protein